MDTRSWVQIICLVLLILFSAFFSASETAFTSLNRIRLKTMADDGNKKAANAYKMGENYDKLLSTVLVGNNIVNITASSVATVLFIKLINESRGPTVSTIIMTVLLLIFGEVTPKTVAKEMPERYAMFATPFLKAITVILTPVVAFFMLWKKLLSKIFKFKKDDTITGDELLNIVDEAESGGGLDEDESDLIRSAISFYECPVGDILTPRVDVIAVSKDDSVEKIASVFNDSGFSRLPVYSDDTDDIIGFITRGHGVSIHTRACSNVPKDLENCGDKERWINAYWDSSVKEDFRATLMISCLNRVGMLADISVQLANMHVMINDINTRNFKDGRSTFSMTITVSGIEHLKSVAAKLERIDGVLSVERGAT